MGAAAEPVADATPPEVLTLDPAPTAPESATAATMARDKLIDVVRKTLVKMSPAAIAAAQGLTLPAVSVEVIEQAAAQKPGITVDIRRLLLARSMRPLPGNQPLVQAIQRHGEDLGILCWRYDFAGALDLCRRVCDSELTFE